MVTGDLSYSTNQPKRAKIRSQSHSASKERAIAARTLLALDQNDSTTLPTPEVLTATLLIGNPRNLIYSRTFAVLVSK